jgi:hypothetical protein
MSRQANGNSVPPPEIKHMDRFAVARMTMKIDKALSRSPVLLKML